LTRLAGAAEPSVERALGASSLEWSRGDVARLVITLYLLFASVILLFDDRRARIEHTGDNSFYASHAAAIRGTPPPGLGATHFLGYPLLVAPVAALFQVSEIDALPMVSLSGSLVAIGLAGELWGPWVAAWFAVVNLDWIQRSLLGGADPPFAAFVFAALLCARKERWNTAATFGALATVVRPLGVFSLVAIGLVLLWRKSYLSLAVAIAISLVLAGLYLALMHSLFGAALANVTWYRSMGLGHDKTFIPFVTLFIPTPGHALTWKNVFKTAAWTSITLAALAAAIFRKEMRSTLRSAPVEWIFGATYTASFLFFPAWWIEGEYPRYFGPVVPLCLVALQPWLPERKSLVWMIGLACVLLAAIEDMPVFLRLVETVLRSCAG
jgi:hypothetical protein